MATSSAGTMVEFKIIRSGQKHSETRSILLDFKKVGIITALISELLENIDSRDLESLFEKYFKRYRAEFIHLLTILGNNLLYNKNPITEHNCAGNRY